MNKAALNAFLKMIASKLAAGIGGPLVLLWTQVILYLEKVVVYLVENFWKKYIRKAKQDEKQAVLEQKDKDPKSTNDDVGKAYEDFINTGRK